MSNEEYKKILKFIDEVSAFLFDKAYYCYCGDGSDEMMQNAILDSFANLRKQIEEMKNVYQG